VEIRPCSDEDLAQLRELWPTPGTDVHGGHYAAHLRGQATYLVAWKGATPFGSAMVQWAGCVGQNARKAFPDCVEINHLQVRPELRGQGAGTALIRAAEELVAARGLAEVALGVSTDNADARRLYSRLGYVSTGIRDLTSYRWVDSSGNEHMADEEDDLLIKVFRSA